MSSLRDSYAQLTNNGIPKGNITDGTEFTVVGECRMMVSVTLGGGGAVINIDNGNGYVAEAMEEGNSIYDLKPCRIRIDITAPALVSLS